MSDFGGTFDLHSSWFVLFLGVRKLSTCHPRSLIYRAQLKCAGVCDAPANSLYIPTVNTVCYIIHKCPLEKWIPAPLNMEHCRLCLPAAPYQRGPQWPLDAPRSDLFSWAGV